MVLFISHGVFVCFKTMLLNTTGLELLFCENEKGLELACGWGVLFPVLRGLYTYYS